MHIALDYDYFSAFSLMNSNLRRKQIDWFRDKYSKHVAENAPPPSVIAHSFGTLIVARAIQLFNLRFDRIIFCGSIVWVAYPWTKIVQGGLCNWVLNDYGGKDVPVWISEYGVSDAGPSGLKGFSDEAGGRVIQREHLEFSHSDYFYEHNYRKNWIPFLLGKEPQTLTPADLPPTNWKHRIFVGILAVVLLLGIVFAGWQVKQKVWPPTPPAPVPLPRQLYKISAATLIQEIDQVRASYLETQKFNDLHHNDYVILEAVWIVNTTPTGYYLSTEKDNRNDRRLMARFNIGGSLDAKIGHQVDIKGDFGEVTDFGLYLNDCEVIETY